MFRELKVPEPTALLMNNSHLLNFENTQLVTITLRNSKFDLARNSNIPEWIRFAEYLQSLGYKPIIIPDADQPFDKNGLLPKFTDIGLAATYNMGIRLGLYQKAFVNFFVPNGPVVFPINSTSIHYIYMKSWLEDTVMTPTSVSGYSWVDPVALRPYWGNELQMWNGDKDTFDNIKKHFDEFCSRIKGRIESTSSFNR